MNTWEQISTISQWMGLVTVVHYYRLGRCRMGAKGSCNDPDVAPSIPSIYHDRSYL